MKQKEVKNKPLVYSVYKLAQALWLQQEWCKLSPKEKHHTSLEMFCLKKYDMYLHIAGSYSIDIESKISDYLFQINPASTFYDKHVEENINELMDKLI